MTASPVTGPASGAYEDGVGPLGVDALHARYRDRSLRVADVVQAVYDRIARRGDDGTWICVVPRADALRRASELDEQLDDVLDGERPLPPLFGLPFGVKDNIDVTGLPTTAACPEFAYTPERSAPLVEHLLAAGGVVIGKTNLDQFATGLSGARSPYGIPRSPFDPEWISGGSSSGSAVAVATGVVTFAIGTDTAGSGRVPAALTDTVGMKPSRGLVSTRGVVPACRSLDCPSVHARSVADGARVLAVIAGFDGDDPYSRQLPVPPPAAPEVTLDGVRLAVPLPEQLDEAAPWFGAVSDRLASAGAVLVPVDFTPFFEAGALLYEGGWVAERYGGLAAFLASHPDDVHPAVRDVVLRGADVTGADVFASQHRLAALAVSAAAVLRDVDGMLAPTVTRSFSVAQMLADPVRRNARLGRFTTFGNLLDLCGVAVPAGFDAAGMPYGVQVLAPAGRDAFVTGAASAVHCLLLGREPGGAGSGAGGAAAGGAGTTGPVRVAVVGAHLTGQPLNGELAALGGTLVARTTTAPEYRLYALPGGSRPGLLHVPSGGAAIEVEVYDVPVAGLGVLVAGTPSPLSIGSVRLADGILVSGYLCEFSAVAGAEDITSHGGWRAYLEAPRGSR